MKKNIKSSHNYNLQIQLMTWHASNLLADGFCGAVHNSALPSSPSFHQMLHRPLISLFRLPAWDSPRGNLSNLACSSRSIHLASPVSCFKLERAVLLGRRSEAL